MRPWHAGLAVHQRLAGNTAHAKIAGEEARNALDQLYTDQPDNFYVAMGLSRAYAGMGEKDAALKAAEHGIMLFRRTRNAGSFMEENLAFIQAMFGENTRAISTLAQLLQTHYVSGVYGPPPITPALLRLDPFWDSLRSDPAFQKLCEEKQPVALK